MAQPATLAPILQGQRLTILVRLDQISPMEATAIPVATAVVAAAASIIEVE